MFAVVRRMLGTLSSAEIEDLLRTEVVARLGCHAEGRTYVDRKVADGKTKREAIRALKRQISDAVYRQLVIDAVYNADLFDATLALSVNAALGLQRSHTKPNVTLAGVEDYCMAPVAVYLDGSPLPGRYDALWRPRIDAERKIVEFARPAGVIFGLVPSTNPVSTVFYKIVLALLTRNAIVISPHPLAKACCADAARLILKQ